MRLSGFIRNVRWHLLEAKVDQQVAKIKQSFLVNVYKKELARKQGVLSRAENSKTFPEHLRQTTLPAIRDNIEILQGLVANQPATMTPDMIRWKKGFEKQFDMLVDADPSQDKKYLKWIIRWWWDQELPEIANEDLPKVREYLDILRRGVVKGFDINRVKTLPDLYAVVRPYLRKLGQPTNQELERLESQFEYKYRGPEGTVVIPRTKAASCLFGRNTQWCTARTDAHNMFDHYSRSHDPLYIIILPDGERFQLHLGEAQFMDEDDRPVDPDEFIQQNPWIQAALDIQPNHIHDLFRPRYDENQYRRSLDIDFLMKWMVPEKQEQYMIEALGKNPFLITSLDSPTPQMIVSALSSITEQLNQESNDLASPDDYGDEDRYDRMMRLEKELGYIVRDIVYKQLWKPEYNRIIYTQMIWVVDDIPNDMLDEQSVQMAVKHHLGNIIDFYRKVPHLVSNDLIEKAIEKDPTTASVMIFEPKRDMWIARLGLKVSFDRLDKTPDIISNIYNICDVVMFENARRLLKDLVRTGDVREDQLDSLLHDMVFGENEKEVLRRYMAEISQYTNMPF